MSIDLLERCCMFQGLIAGLSCSSTIDRWISKGVEGTHGKPVTPAVCSIQDHVGRMVEIHCLAHTLRELERLDVTPKPHHPFRLALRFVRSSCVAGMRSSESECCPRSDVAV